MFRLADTQGGSGPGRQSVPYPFLPIVSPGADRWIHSDSPIRPPQQWSVRWVSSPLRVGNVHALFFAMGAVPHVPLPVYPFLWKNTRGWISWLGRAASAGETGRGTAERTTGETAARQFLGSLGNKNRLQPTGSTSRETRHPSKCFPCNMSDNSPGAQTNTQTGAPGNRSRLHTSCEATDRPPRRAGSSSKRATRRTSSETGIRGRAVPHKSQR